MTSDQNMENDPEVAPVRQGDELDWVALESYLRETLDDVPTGPMKVAQFPHGSANLTYLVQFGSQRYVVRRPPHGELPPGAHDMAREYAVLSKLWAVYPRAPRAVGFSSDPNIVGAPFLVIEYHPGAVIRSRLPESMSGILDVAAKVSAAFVDAVADLHAVAPEDCGLSELGRPDGFVERQLRGWRRRWEAARRPDSDQSMDDLGELLAANVPTPHRVSLVHSDLKLDNCQFAQGDPTRIVSVFDWDMTTLGDPLIDVGTALSYWPEKGEAGAAARALWPGQEAIGLWTRTQVRARYAELTSLPVDHISWYEAFGSWKTAVALQQLANRAIDGHTRDERLARYAEVVPVAARAARDALGD